MARNRLTWLSEKDEEILKSHGLNPDYYLSDVRYLVKYCKDCILIPCCSEPCIEATAEFWNEKAVAPEV